MHLSTLPANEWALPHLKTTYLWPGVVDRIRVNVRVLLVTRFRD
jgi:hypothetical protein